MLLTFLLSRLIVNKLLKGNDASKKIYEEAGDRYKITAKN